MLKTIRIIAWAAVLIAAFTGGALWMSSLLNRDLGGAAGVAGPASGGIGGAFTLVNTRGERVSEKVLNGRPTALFFGFTYCPDVCPTTLTEATDWLKALGPDGDRLQVVFVTVDPQRDTTEALAKYLTAFDPRIQGWTGTEAEVEAIKTAYRVYARKVPTGTGPTDYTMDHTATVYLLNAGGQFTGSIAYQEARDTAIAKLRRLLAG